MNLTISIFKLTEKMVVQRVINCGKCFNMKMSLMPTKFASCTYSIVVDGEHWNSDEPETVAGVHDC